MYIYCCPEDGTALKVHYFMYLLLKAQVYPRMEMNSAVAMKM